TNPLLTLIGAAIQAAGVGPGRVPLALDVLNLAASAAVLLMLFRFWGDDRDGNPGRVPKPSGDDRAAGLVAGALYVLGGQHLFYAHAGYEVYLQAAALI